MATTGQQFGQYLRQKIDQAYTGYFDSTKLNRAIDETFYRAVEKKYLELSTQKQYDEIRNLLTINFAVTLQGSKLYLDPLQLSSVSGSGTVLIITKKPHYLLNNQSVTISGVQGITGVNGTFTASVLTPTTFNITAVTAGLYMANTGIVTPSNSIVDYAHYLFSRVKIYGTSISVSKVLTGSTTTITTTTSHNLRTGDSVVIAGVVGVTGINQEHTSIVVLNSKKFTIGTTSGTYASGGTVQLVNNQEVRFRRADQKGFVYTSAKNNEPKFEMGDGIIFYYPDTATQVTIDYVKKMPQVIDVNDNTIDLENWYPKKFLGYLSDEITLNLASQIRDNQLQQSAASAIINNP